MKYSDRSALPTPRLGHILNPANPKSSAADFESDENDVYQYQLPDAPSGFLRVSLITGHSPAENLSKSFQKGPGNVEVSPTTGNFIARSEKA